MADRKKAELINQQYAKELEKWHNLMIAANQQHDVVISLHLAYVKEVTRGRD